MSWKRKGHSLIFLGPQISSDTENSSKPLASRQRPKASELKYYMSGLVHEELDSECQITLYSLDQHVEYVQYMYKIW